VCVCVLSVCVCVLGGCVEWVRGWARGRFALQEWYMSVGRDPGSSTLPLPVCPPPPQVSTRRTPHDCKLQWLYAQRPGINRGEWSEEELDNLRRVALEAGVCWLCTLALPLPHHTALRTPPSCSLRVVFPFWCCLGAWEGGNTPVAGPTAPLFLWPLPPPPSSPPRVGLRGQERDWAAIAAALGTNRHPMDCFKQFRVMVHPGCVVHSRTACISVGF
jgi:hypothetical protein